MPKAGLQDYARKRDFTQTPEPRGDAPAKPGGGRMFVVQKHAARRAGLHWDFRLEHDGVLWSWAVPKGPSLDPADRRMAIHVEDHPVDYAAFQGDIAEGYGAGHVETWDRGRWEPLEDPDAGMRAGHLRFVLHGKRLSGRFTLARLKGRRGKAEAWFLIKGHDVSARDGADAGAMEAAPVDGAPAAGAVRRKLPRTQAPQLCVAVDDPPDGEGWLSEIKFDGYRLIAAVEDGQARLLTRKGLDWAGRLPRLSAALAALPGPLMLDGELVALRDDGASSFPDLQAALGAGREDGLAFFTFDLLHLHGWDLRRCALLERKRLLAGLLPKAGLLRFSDHQLGHSHDMRRHACRMHLEGIVCKRADAPYLAGRGHDWVKLKCQGREEFVVLGWTPPAGARTGLGSLHVGYFDATGRLHYAGGVGSGFDEAELRGWRRRLDRMASDQPAELQITAEPVEPGIRWVRPELVVEVQYAGWSGGGRLRHAVSLGLREDKAAEDVVRDVADGTEARSDLPGRKRAGGNRVVVARKPKAATAEVGGVEITHADRPLWPGITKRDLAEYWQAVAPAALPGLLRRPLAVLRCPGGIGSQERFFQKHGHAMPGAVREGEAGGQPYLAVDGLEGVVALAQMSAIELHPWGATEADPTHPDRLVFDLDPGEGVAWPDVIAAAHDVRKRLEKLGLQSFCRTTGGKGLHVVAPLRPEADWERARPFCKAFAAMLAEEAPDRYLAHVKIADRKQRILVDWLRNGLGATAVASFCPRARPGATVATPLAWREVTDRLDPQAFTVRSVPQRLGKLRADPWAGFDAADQALPDLRPPPRRRSKDDSSKDGPAAKPGRAVIVQARKPSRRG